MRRLVIFDIDGTICDTNDVDDRCYVAAVSSLLGTTPEEVDWSDAPHMTDSAILAWLSRRHLGRDVARGEDDLVVARFVDLLQHERIKHSSAFRPIRGALEILERLEAAGWQVSFATGGWRSSAELKLRHIGIEVARYVLATASDATTREGIVSIAISATQAGASEEFGRIVSVGDGTWDVTTAAALELPFVGIGEGPRADQLYRAGAERVLPDFRDQEAFLRALDNAPVPRNARVSV